MELGEAMNRCPRSAGQRCCLIIDGTQCGRAADLHARGREDDRIHWLCGPCAGVLPAQLRKLLAWHAGHSACRHPDAMWFDEGCIVPVVDESLEEILAAGELELAGVR